jgi:hypothetical protein
MEVTIAEKSVYIPPVMIGIALFYRTMMYGLFTNHPILRPLTYAVAAVSFVSDKIMNSVTYLMGSSQEKALIVQSTSVAILDSVVNTMALVVHQVQNVLSLIRFQVRNIFFIASNITAGVFRIVTKTTDALGSIRFQFQTVVQQTANFTSGIFTSIHKNTDAVTSTFSMLRNYFFPKPKTFMDYLPIVIGFLVAFTVIGLTVYYLSQTRERIVELPREPVVEKLVTIVEPEKPKDMTPVRRNPVRRKAKVN